MLQNCSVERLQNIKTISKAVTYHFAKQFLLLKASSARASNPSSPSTSRRRTGTWASSSNALSSTRGNRARFRRKWRVKRGAAPSSPAAAICSCSTRSVWCSAPSCRRVSPCWDWRSSSGSTCASTYSGSLSPICLRWGEAGPLAYYTYIYLLC